MTKPSSKHDQPEDLPHGQATYTSMGIRRRVSVKGMQGVDATVIVTVVQGKVWMSIMPPFTWEAIMEPGKVDEVMSALGVARDEAKKMAAARSGRASPAGKAVVRAITSSPII
ncbi:MAG: hypothetical protein ACRDTD_09095 [Pseudonocardiaceae bacterium]